MHLIISYYNFYEALKNAMEHQRQWVYWNNAVVTLDYEMQY